MDWSRTGSYIELSLWALQIGLCWFGGWMICAGVFRLRPRERLAVGLAAGLLLFSLFGNVLALALPLDLAYWTASGLIAGIGAAALRSFRREWNPRDDLLAWPVMAAVGALFLLFLGINRGLAIFDDYSNLPLVSMIASGDVPPRFYLNPQVILDDYHYGLHLLAASLVRIGGFYPWAALDIFKALSIALAATLGALWFRRYMRPIPALTVGGVFVLFGGGARWLLLLLPRGLLERLGERVELIGSAMQTATDLVSALAGPWRIAGDGPFPFPFAFISGVSRPVTLAMGSNAALPTITLFLLLLLARRRWTPASGLIYGLLLAALSPVSDHLFALAWSGMALAGVLAAWRRGPAHIRSWAWVLIPGALIVPVLGGAVAAIFSRLVGTNASGLAVGGVGLPGIALRWPPALMSSHLGALDLTDPAQLALALIELGPLVLLAIPVTLAIRSYLHAGKLLHAGLALMALVGFLAPLFIRFIERERDITRLTGAALSIWAALGMAHAWQAFNRARPFGRFALGAGFAAVIFGGAALFPAQLIAALQPQPSYFISAPDVAMSRELWNRLPEDAWVLDPVFAYRPAALFARTTGPAFRSVYIAEPSYRALLADLTPITAAAAGYDYLYITRDWWSRLSPEQKDVFRKRCVTIATEYRSETGDFRRLLDIRACKPAP